MLENTPEASSLTYDPSRRGPSEDGSLHYICFLPSPDIDRYIAFSGLYSLFKMLMGCTVIRIVKTHFYPETTI